MEKIKVWRIAIGKDKVFVYPKDGKMKEYPREVWAFVIDDVKQVQVSHNNVLVLPEEPYFCEEGNLTLFCGKEPEKVMIL